MADYSRFCFSPKNTEWDAELFTILNLIKHINDQFWVKFGYSKFDDQQEHIRRNLKFIETKEITISLDSTILNYAQRTLLGDAFEGAGWSDVEFRIWESHQDDKEIKPITDRQREIMLGEIDPDEHERPIPAHWQVVLKK